jgi:hypothetical protein
MGILQSEPFASTTRISTDLEKLWRSHFFASQESTPADSPFDLEVAEPQKNIRQMTSNVRFAGGVYDSTIIKFYEDIILELQREVERYKLLWESSRVKVEEEAEESYVARETVRLSPGMAEKLRRATRAGLRVSAD